jgi:hypothetical protein
MAKTGDYPTTTTIPARVRIFQPSQRPTARRGDWIETAWGRVRVSGRLGQRHADIYEAIRHTALDSRARDGQTDLLVDPARVRRVLGQHYSYSTLWRLLDEIMQAVVEIDTPGVRGLGYLIDSVTESKKRARDPLTGGERTLWVVRLGLAARALDERDLPLHYDPAPVARLQHGISQAVARHVLTHKTEPRGGWSIDGLIIAVAGEIGEQAMRDARRRVRADAAGLAELGVEIDGDRVRRVLERPDSVAQRPDSVAQRPDSVAQRPDTWHNGPTLSGTSGTSEAGVERPRPHEKGHHPAPQGGRRGETLWTTV